MSWMNRLKCLPRQIGNRSPFGGSLTVQRLPILATAGVTARNFRTPLRILDFVFKDDVDLKYLDVPGLIPILFVRDPELIRVIAAATAHDGDFDRDTLPTQGIGRVVGTDNLLYSQGEQWRVQKGAVTRPLGKAVQAPEVFKDLEQTVRAAVEPRLREIALRVRQSPTSTHRMRLEPEIKAVMLDVLVNVLFGLDVAHDELRGKYLPALENVIRHIMLDTVINPFRLPVFALPSLSPAHARLKRDRRVFEELTDRVVAARAEGAGFWPLLTAAGTDSAIRSNVRVFLAGALEATASYVSWTLSDLARDPAAQERAYQEAQQHVEIGPAAREGAVYLRKVLSESLRLHNALYFLPRVALRDTTVTTSRGTLQIPAHTHIVLATYHTNRCEKYWGVEATGYPATAFVPERWDEANLQAHGKSAKDSLHFGFGHGPRVCVGKQFSEVEAFVCVTLFLRRFAFTAVQPSVEADSGVSTRPRDGVELELSLRFFDPEPSSPTSR